MHGPGSTTGSSRLSRSVAGPLLLTLLTVGCDDDGGAPSAGLLPTRFEAAADLGAVPFFEDLDGDERDEIIQVFRPTTRRPGRTSVLIRTPENPDVYRLDYVGSVGRPHVLDFDGDGTREIFIPVVRGDTLHLSVADARGNELLEVPLVTGRPRIEPEGELPWDPTVLGFHLVDLTRNGRRELVSVVSTGYARYPRGVFVHTLPRGRLIDSLTVGARLSHASLVEPRSGGSVLVLAARATHNGAVAGGFDDHHSYAMAVDLRIPLRVRWSRELGGVGSRAWIRPVELTGNRDADRLVVATGETGSRLALLSSSAGVTLRSRDLPPLSYPIVTDLEGDGRPEIVAIEGGTGLVTLNPGFEVEERVPLPAQVGYLREWPDLDGDGRRELSAFDGAQRRHLLLDRDRGVKAALPGVGSRSARDLDVFRRGPTETPVLVTRAADGYRGFELSKDRLYLVRRFGPPAAAAAGPLLFIFLAAAALRARRRYRQSKRTARALRARPPLPAVPEERPPERPILRVESGRRFVERAPPRRRKAGQERDPGERKRRPA